MPLIFFFTWWDSGQTFHTPTKYMKFTLSIPPIIFSPNAVPYQVIHSHVCLPTIPSSFFFIVFVTCFSLYATSQTMSSSKKARTESHFYFISDPVLNLALAHGSFLIRRKTGTQTGSLQNRGLVTPGNQLTSIGTHFQFCLG